MTQEKRNPAVNSAQLEEAFGVDLEEFEAGKTYPLATLLDKLKFRNGTPKLRRGHPQKSEKEIAEEKT